LKKTKAYFYLFSPVAPVEDKVSNFILIIVKRGAFVSYGK